MSEMSQAALYLLKVEAFRIDNSPPAPMTTLVSGPTAGDGAAAPTEALLQGELTPGSPEPDDAVIEIPLTVAEVGTVSVETQVATLAAEAITEVGGVSNKAPRWTGTPRASCSTSSGPSF